MSLGRKDKPIFAGIIRNSEPIQMNRLFGSHCLLQISEFPENSLMSGCPDFNPRQRHRPVGYDSRALTAWGPGSWTLAEQLSCSFMLLGFVPMHSDSQQFVRVAVWAETFTAVTRVRIPSGTPNQINNLQETTLKNVRPFASINGFPLLPQTFRP